MVRIYFRFAKAEEESNEIARRVPLEPVLTSPQKSRKYHPSHRLEKQEIRHSLKKRLVVESHTAGQTKKLGRLVGELLKPGSLVALSGELGAGKTQFVKGLAGGLGVDRSYYVSSPSFVLINEYPGRIPLYHLDLYRLSEYRDLEEIGLEEYLNSNGVTTIEWAEKAAQFMPSELIWIDIHWTGPESRQITLRAAGKRNVLVIEAIHKKLEGEKSLRNWKCRDHDRK